MTKQVCFVDSVAWIAMLNADDELHEKTNSVYKKLMKSGYHFVTSTGVLNEVANALSKPKHRSSVTELHARLQQSSRIEIIFVDESLWLSGWELYENRADKEWSLTDCISMVVMQERNLKDAFTSDKHFIQAGFNALLRN